MLKIGITGGIGSGKSTVSKIFEVLGIPVYYADEEAKKLMNEDEDLKEKLTAIFGKDTYAGNQLNRAYLAGAVFNNPQQLAKLNSIVHPATIAAADKWMTKHSTAQNIPYAIKEAALIFESGSQEFLDKVIGVYAPAAVRINRVMKRDSITREQVIARMDKQLNETIKMRLCDYVITNNEQELLIPQVIAVHEQLTALAKQQKTT